MTAGLKALQIDGMLAEAHTSLAMVHLLYDWVFAASEKELRRALELDRDYATAHHWYSHCLLPLGRKEESLAESRRALELEPLHLASSSTSTWAGTTSMRASTTRPSRNVAARSSWTPPSLRPSGTRRGPTCRRECIRRPLRRFGRR
jgi:tetratricopeptide (TPR) repeat protein